MTRAQELAKGLRQIVVLFWLLGILATLGYGVMIFSAMSVSEDQFMSGGAIVGLVVQLVAVWIGLGWMGMMANGLAELLSPSSPAS